jgi:hypothetical protein
MFVAGVITRKGRVRAAGESMRVLLHVASFNNGRIVREGVAVI